MAAQERRLNALRQLHGWHLFNMKYELSDTIINNIKGFLLRTDLKGKEVPAYLDILNSLVPIEDAKPNERGQDISGDIKPDSSSDK